MKEPLSNLEQCSGCTYALQLSSYQYVIEKYYNLKVVGRCLVSLHPDKPFFTPVPYLRHEVEYIMSTRRLRTATRKRLEMDSQYSGLRCSITGRLAENAVQDEEGKLYWDKAAALHEIPNTVPCAAVAEQVEDLLQKNMPLPQYPEVLIPWRKQYTGPKNDLMAYSS